MLGTLAKFAASILMALGLLTNPSTPTHTSLFGAPITQGGALYDGYLASGIGSSDSSMTLSSGAFRDGTSLSGWNCFTVDVNTPSVEYICGTASGTAVSGMWRGVSVVNPNTTSSGSSYTHNRFASVSITDYPDLQIVKRILNGTDATPSGTILKYDANITSSSFTNSQQLPSKAYVDSVAISGAPNGSLIQKGIYQEATKAQTAAGTGSGSTGADLIVPNAYFSQTPSATATVPMTNGLGTLPDGFIGQGVSDFYNFLGGVQMASTTFTNATSGVLTTDSTGKVSSLQPGATNNVLLSNGSLWTATSTHLSFLGATSTTVSPVSGTATTTASLVLPSAGQNSEYDIKVFIYAIAGSASATSTVSIGGTQIGSCNQTALAGGVAWNLNVRMVNSTSSELITGTMAGSAGGLCALTANAFTAGVNTLQMVTSSIDLSSSPTLAVGITEATGASTLTRLTYRMTQ